MDPMNFLYLNRTPDRSFEDKRKSCTYQYNQLIRRKYRINCKIAFRLVMRYAVNFSLQYQEPVLIGIVLNVHGVRLL